MDTPFDSQPSAELSNAIFREYVDLLRTNKGYACLVVAEVFVLLGYYLSYIAILSIITEYGDGGAMLLSLLSLLQSLPAFLWFPVTGAVADRCARAHPRRTWCTYTSPGLTATLCWQPSLSPAPPLCLAFP